MWFYPGIRITSIFNTPSNYICQNGAIYIKCICPCLTGEAMFFSLIRVTFFFFLFPQLNQNQLSSSVDKILRELKPPQAYFLGPGNTFAYSGPDRNWETRGAAQRRGWDRSLSSWFGVSPIFTPYLVSCFHRLLISGSRL